MSTTIRRIHTRSLRLLAPVLNAYLKMNERLALHWMDEDDVPWWYNERASLGIFAAAIWKAGGISFEEFVDKKHPHKLRPSKGMQSGRTDLFFSISGHSFVVEAKNSFVDAHPRNTSSRHLVQGRLNRAIEDVKRVKRPGSKRLAVLFVAPRFPLNARPQMDRHIRRWISELTKIKYSAAAWTFPASTRTNPAWREWRCFPGVAMLIKEIR